MDLPVEILEIIIEFTMPDGFEKLTVTSRRLHALCSPLIKRHNLLRSHFRHFSFKRNFRDPSFQIMNLFDLLARIAAEPLVAHYIRQADFTDDGFFAYGQRPKSYPDVINLTNMARVFTHSSYLKEAGIDGEEYYADIEAELQTNKYSQHAAAFLLTLLPNLQTLTLPKLWIAGSSTNQIVSTIVHRVQRGDELPGVSSSLKQMTRLESPDSRETLDDLDVSVKASLLALSHVRSFCASEWYLQRSTDLYSLILGENLAAVYLTSCDVDEIAIYRFLKNMKSQGIPIFSRESKLSTLLPNLGCLRIHKGD